MLIVELLPSAIENQEFIAVAADNSRVNIQHSKHQTL